jgi:tRNA modification GTPase
MQTITADTIAAISTPPGRGAVGIIRISGPASKDILKKVWINPEHPVDSFATHRMYYGKISTSEIPPHPPLQKGGFITIDNVLAVWMKGPHSYTGEDVVEINCHGGSFTTKAVLSAVLTNGARSAGPGEFTRRAFLNGRLDLVQAEAVAEVINATSERALRLANEQLSGRLSNEIKTAMEGLKGLKAFVEASIDFPEEDIELLEHEDIGKKLAGIASLLERLSSTYNEGRLIRDGVRAAIVGKPNVGKSSLLNALLGSDRAIVHHVPGTTRDVIEDDITLDGITFRLIDTAGIRESNCEVELMGVNRAKMRLSEADVALVVLDPTRPFDKDDEAILKETVNIKSIIVLNKKDLLSDRDEETIDFDDSTKKLLVSAKTLEGVPELKEQLVRFVTNGQETEGEGFIITSLRHKKAIDSAVASLERAASSIEQRESAEFAAHHLQIAMDSLGKVTGEVTTDDVLNEIFSKFCIGK